MACLSGKGHGKNADNFILRIYADYYVLNILTDIFDGTLFAEHVMLYNLCGKFVMHNFCCTFDCNLYTIHSRGH